MSEDSCYALTIGGVGTATRAHRGRRTVQVLRLALTPITPPILECLRFSAPCLRKQRMRHAFIVQHVWLRVGLGVQQLCELFAFAVGPFLCMRSVETDNLYAIQSNPPNVLLTGND